MTLAIVLIIGTLGTLALGYAGYRKLAGQRQAPPRYTPTPVVTVPPAQPLAPPIAVPSRKKVRGRVWLWIVFILLGIYGPITYFSYQIHKNEERKRSVSVVAQGLRGLASHLPSDLALPIIAQCESGGRQLNPDGSVVTNSNSNGTIDRGKWQINSSHDEEVKRLGINIMTEEGNRRFAEILYTKNALQDWEATRHCWGPKLLALGQGRPSRETVAVAPTPPTPPERNTRFAAKYPYCWEERRPRNRFSHPIRVYGSASPTEPASFKGKLVCVR